MSGDAFVKSVRAALTKWKHEQLQNSVQQDQDTTKLNLYLKKTAIAYDMLRKYLDEKAKVDASLQPLVDILGDPSNLNSEDERLIRDFLFRDLIEYPFTYNAALINSFGKRNVLNTNIVPNK